MKKKKLCRRLIVLGICCVLIGVVVFSIIYCKKYDYSHLVTISDTEKGTEFKSNGSDSRLEGMVMAAETDTLSLFINEQTAEVAIIDKRNDKIWRSNPADRENDSLTNELTANSLASQFDITYFDSNRMEKTFSSYADSVEKQQFKIESIKDGVRVTYTLGDLSLGSAALPKYITAERLEEKVLSKLTDKKQIKAIKQFYVEDDDKEGFLIFLESAKNSEINLNRILSGFSDAGYTSEDLAYENQQSGIEVKQELQYAVIPLEYRLTNDKLSVNIKTTDIEETEGIQIGKIELMKFFGAGGIDEEGYMFVPSGSGGIINFNNGKTAEETYKQSIYGNDMTTAGRYRTQVAEEARMPVYGINKKDCGMLAYISNGDTLSKVVADISGKVNSYNFVYPEFTLRTASALEMTGVSGSESDMTVVEKKMYQGDLTIDYCFLTDENADYSGMARYYRNILEENGDIKTLDEKDSIPFYLDTVGAAEKEKFIVGIPYNGIVNMTTYEQANLILDELEKQGITNVQMRYLGWFNDGINHDSPENIDLISSLGSKKDMQELNERLKENGGGLYPDVEMQLVCWRSKNYSESKDSIRGLAGWSGNMGEYNRATLRMGSQYEANWFEMVSPNVLPEIVSKFLPTYEKLEIDNLSLRDMGDLLSSDKRKRYPINRQIAKSILEEQLEKMSSNQNLLLTGGNSFALKYTNQIVNVPDSGNDFYIIDETIPFYEMVIHGSIDYAGDALNTSEAYDYNTSILKMLEYGLAPHYCWSYEDSSKLIDSAYERYYSTNYKNWIEEATEAYKTVNDVYQNLRTVKIKQHNILQEGVHETVYENGTSIIVNYTDESVKVGNKTIEANSYAVGGDAN